MNRFVGLVLYEILRNYAKKKTLNQNYYIYIFLFFLIYILSIIKIIDKYNYIQFII